MTFFLSSGSFASPAAKVIMFAERKKEEGKGLSAPVVVMTDEGVVVVVVVGKWLFQLFFKNILKVVVVVVVKGARCFLCRCSSAVKKSKFRTVKIQNC